MSNTFRAKVQKIESNIKGTFNPCVVVPDKIVFNLLNEAKKKNPPIQVKIVLNGKNLQLT